MFTIDNLINQIAQNKIDFENGYQQILAHKDYEFINVFSSLQNYILNSIPDKINYSSEVFQNAIKTIPLKETITPIAILKSSPTKIAFNKLQKLPKSEELKILISLLWIFKQTDSNKRNTECKNGCNHEWHNP